MIRKEEFRLTEITLIANKIKGRQQTTVNNVSM